MYGDIDLPSRIEVDVESLKGSFAWPSPTCTRITSGYGYRIHPVTKQQKMHHGVDIAHSQSGKAMGEPVIAVHDGIVQFARSTTSAAGKYIKIVHNVEGKQVTTKYLHLSYISVKEGQEVTMGDVIGAIGNTGIGTGAHLHFEIRSNPNYNSIDPLSFLR